jgi:putative oxidoreductase
MPNLTAWSPRVLSLLRVIVALLLMEHGLMKLFHFPAPQPGGADPLPPIMLAAAGIEVVGGGLIALGLFTRPAAFVASGEMAAACFMVHAPKSFWPGSTRATQPSCSASPSSTRSSPAAGHGPWTGPCAGWSEGRSERRSRGSCPI